MIGRLVTFLVGAALLALGLGFVLWRMDVEWIRTLVAHADPAQIRRVPREPWWQWLLGSIAIGCAVTGAALLIAHLRPRRSGTVELAGSSEFGSYTAHVGQVAKAAATMLGRHNSISSAAARTVSIKGHSTIHITVVAEPDVTLDHVRRLAAESTRDIGTALAGTDVTVSVFVQAAAPLTR